MGKKYLVYAPVREFWVFEVEANSKKEAIQKVRYTNDGIQVFSVNYLEAPIPRFVYQAVVANQTDQ